MPENHDEGFFAGHQAQMGLAFHPPAQGARDQGEVARGGPGEEGPGGGGFVEFLQFLQFLHMGAVALSAGNANRGGAGVGVFHVEHL